MKKIVLALMPIMATGLLINCGSKKSDNWWDNTANLTKSDIGKIEEVEINGQKHQVRLIGVDHDILADDPREKAHTTWEFVNLISDKKGNSIATSWGSNAPELDPFSIVFDSNNFDYINSGLRERLDMGGNGTGSGYCSWFQKNQPEPTPDAIELPATVFEMLPTGLQKALKAVNKRAASCNVYYEEQGGVLVEIHTWHTDTAYNTKLFPLSYSEMTQEDSMYTIKEGSTYEYYKQHTDSKDRIKHQVNWHEEALTYPIKTSVKPDAENNLMSYAGYNGSMENEGGIYLLRSANVYSDTSATEENKLKSVAIGPDGSFAYTASHVYLTAMGVAPAFCI